MERPVFRPAGSVSPSYRRSTASAAPGSNAAPVIGPDPITDGSSSLGTQTSEIASVIDRPASAEATPGRPRAASCPPLIPDRCRRTRFISSIDAPAPRSADVARALSSIVRPAAGTASIADAPPERHTTSRSRFRAASSASESAALPAASLCAVGTGWPASNARHCRPNAAATSSRDRPVVMMPAVTRSPNTAMTASAMPHAALPAATTRAVTGGATSSRSPNNAVSVTRRASTAESAADTIELRC